jgi:hypothetical protein
VADWEVAAVVARVACCGSLVLNTAKYELGGNFPVPFCIWQECSNAIVCLRNRQKTNLEFSSGWHNST